MKRKILLTSLAIILFSNISYSDYDSVLMMDKEKTIKELKLNLEDLDKVKNDLEDSKSEIRLNSELYSYLKEDISSSDNSALLNILSDYNKKRATLEKQLKEASNKLKDTTTISANLFDLRKKLYDSILPYVDTKKSSKYLEYFNKQTKSYLEELQVDADIIKKSVIVNEKINNIEEKIKEHREYLNTTLKNLINDQINVKIDTIIEWEAFQSMTLDQKLSILDKIIKKVDDMQKWFIYENNVLNVSQNLKANNNKKVEICIMVMDRFIQIKKELQTWK